jgi:hypothetical protein
VKESILHLLEVKSIAPSALIGKISSAVGHGSSKAARTGGKLGLLLAMAGTVSPPFFRLRLSTITNKGLPRLAPPQERQVDTHKPVLCGVL